MIKIFSVSFICLFVGGLMGYALKPQGENTPLLEQDTQIINTLFKNYIEESNPKLKLDHADKLLEKLVVALISSIGLKLNETTNIWQNLSDEDKEKINEDLFIDFTEATQAEEKQLENLIAEDVKKDQSECVPGLNQNTKSMEKESAKDEKVINIYPFLGTHKGENFSLIIRQARSDFKNTQPFIHFKYPKGIVSGIVRAKENLNHRQMEFEMGEFYLFKVTKTSRSSRVVFIDRTSIDAEVYEFESLEIFK